MDEIKKGTIKKLVQDKGFGFIAPEDNSKDVFFHTNALIGATFEQLKEGDAVTFKTENSPKGLNAVDVTLA